LNDGGVCDQQFPLMLPVGTQPDHRLRADGAGARLSDLRRSERGRLAVSRFQLLRDGGKCSPDVRSLRQNG